MLEMQGDWIVGLLVCILIANVVIAISGIIIAVKLCMK